MWNSVQKLLLDRHRPDFEGMLNDWLPDYFDGRLKVFEILEIFNEKYDVIAIIGYTKDPTCLYRIIASDAYGVVNVANIYQEKL